MPAKSAWNIAFSAVVEFSRRPRKAEQITERWSKHSSDDRRRAFRLFYAWLRGQGLARAVLGPLMAKAPRKNLQLLLELACSEIYVSDAHKHPAVVSSAIDFAKSVFSSREAGLCNAVLRKAVLQLRDVPLTHSHPRWLVDRWTKTHGKENTQALLSWNQAIPTTYVRWSQRAGPPLPSLIPTRWPTFFTFTDEDRKEILDAVHTGRAYIQDPFTRHPVEMALEDSPGTILDLCAAPGGKTRALVDALTSPTAATIVASDLPGPRLEQLKDNLSVLPEAARPRVFGADATALKPEALLSLGLPGSFGAVILDVPCSNTGVIQRRPDVRWLTKPPLIKELLRLQASLADAAASLVEPGGRLIYSTCSLEAEENALQVEAFLTRNPSFRLDRHAISYPWVDQHDGGAAFTLTRER